MGHSFLDLGYNPSEIVVCWVCWVCPYHTTYYTQKTATIFYEDACIEDYSKIFYVWSAFCRRVWKPLKV